MQPWTIRNPTDPNSIEIEAPDGKSLNKMYFKNIQIDFEAASLPTLTFVIANVDITFDRQSPRASGNSHEWDFIRDNAQLRLFDGRGYDWLQHFGRDVQIGFPHSDVIEIIVSNAEIHVQDGITGTFKYQSVKDPAIARQCADRIFRDLDRKLLGASEPVSYRCPRGDACAGGKKSYPDPGACPVCGRESVPE